MNNSEIENKKKIEELNNTIKTQTLNLLSKDKTIEKNEESLKQIKQHLSTKNKDLKQMKSFLNESIIKIYNQSTLLSKKSRLINKLTEEVKDLTEEIKDLKNENTKLCIKVNSISTKINIIRYRDFLRTIIIDFCYFFDVVKYNNFKEAEALINEKNKKINDSSLQEFEKKVNLIKFIECLGSLIDDSDNLSYLFFKELSIKYKNKNKNQITNV